MPFIGRDWRSPGEAWVKTESLGWQRMKIIESQLYPATCHSQSPACSWPPRSDYGRHMDSHCSQAAAGGRDRERCDTGCGRLASRAPGEPVAMRCNSGSADSAASPVSSGSSSSNSSRGSSLSPSPSSSPEKNTTHHIHPIAISSPYGWHSCFAHHPATTASNCCCAKNHYHHHLNQSTLSRSLSKESLVSASNNLNETRNVTMRYNRSVSDFRQTSDFGVGGAPTNNQSSRADEPPSDDNDDNSDGSSSVQRTKNQIGCTLPPLNPPKLMKNGQRIETSNSDDATTTTGCSRRSEQETAVELSKPMVAIRQASCCCSTGATSPCHLYPFVREQSIGGGTAKTAPHCRISVRTREVAMYNTISEAFYRLDFCNAIHDIRRFNYICKLLHLLITQNLTSLSGCATRVLFTMLEQVAWEVSNNKRNIHILKNLLKELRQMIEKYYCWGRPIGSSLLWQQHFETIERISQMVDGIELAPPKGETSQPSWNDLPVEMIREILLRLNDYRDLVNSAQASPVMQIMIDNQYIWQKLCKYHFTEQQLRVALENRSNYQSLSPIIKQRTNSVHGVKYARTSSADGRSSYRNPVKPSASATVAASTNSGASIKSKKQETSAGPSSRQQKCAQVVNQTSNNVDQSSSYVTRTIRIFDSEGSSATLSSNRVRRGETESLQKPPVAANQDQSPINIDSQRRQPRSNGSASSSSAAAAAARQQERSTATSSANNSRSSAQSSSTRQEIDWERVFHQLRKKFDLKEEYPDCLLLCRHCRCLFWKSFGHPCIKNEADARLDDKGGKQEKSSSCGSNSDQQPSSSPIGNRTSRGSEAMDAVTPQANGSERRPGFFRGSRPSVADLSRNFMGERPSISESSDSRENIRPSQGDGRNSNSVNGDHLGRPMGANLDAAQLPRASAPVHRIPQDARRILREDNNNNPSSQRPSTSTRKDELIPKHVAISPQAFLKFFSL